MLKQLVPCSNSGITFLRHFEFCAYLVLIFHHVFKIHMHGERMEMFMCAEMHSDHIVKWSLKLADLNKNLIAVIVVCKFFSAKFYENPCTNIHNTFNRHSAGMQTGSAYHWNELFKLCGDLDWYVRFKFLTAALLKIEIWEVMPFGRVFPDVAKDCSAFSFRVNYLTLKVKALQLL